MRNAWQSPDGEIKRVRIGWDHIDVPYSNGKSEEQYFEIGYIRLTHDKKENILWAENPCKLPSRKQKSELINLSIEEKILYVIYSNGKKTIDIL